jgi:hypothetical protein
MIIIRFFKKTVKIIGNKQYKSQRFFSYLNDLNQVGLALIIVISAPSFATVLGVLGSLCSFTISVSVLCLLVTCTCCTFAPFGPCIGRVLRRPSLA